MSELRNLGAAQQAASDFPDFVTFQVSRLCVTAALEMQSVAVGWQVYEMTKQPLALGLVGLAQFLPVILLFLISGHAADRFDRRKLLAFCYAGFGICSAALLWASVGMERSVVPVYVVLVMIGIVRAFVGPAARAILPQLVSTDYFPKAVAWSATTWQAATLLGPAVGGVIYAIFNGPSVVYVLAVVVAGVGAFLMFRMSPHVRVASEDAFSVDTILAGFRYIFRRRIILGSISLDLFAVLFGGAVALLPVYAAEILHTGPWGLGMLRSAPAVGALTMAVFLAQRPLRRKVGPTLFWCVGGFGLFTILFGLSRNLWISLCSLLLLGACDMVSVIIRNTLVQLATPDEMRGRVTAVEMIFIDASNEFGQFESGITGQWFGSVPAVVLGGVGSLIVTVLWAYSFPELRTVDVMHPGPREHVQKASSSR